MKNSRVIIVLLILIATTMFVNVKNVYADNNINNNDIFNVISDKENVQYELNKIVDILRENGLTKDNLLEVINKYQELSKKYTNDEIAQMLDNNKSYLEEQNISTANIDSINKILTNFDTEQLNKVIDKVNIDEVLSELDSGVTLLQVIEKSTVKMTATDKIDLAVSLLLSSKIIRGTAILAIILIIYRTLLRIVIYKKADRNPWAAIIPFYKQVTMLKVCGMSPWWTLLVLIPVIGWVILWLVSVASKFMLAEAFDKGVGFAFGLWLLWPIFDSILAFSRESKYVGFEE